jgi:hypothetical protein
VDDGDRQPLEIIFAWLHVCVRKNTSIFLDISRIWHVTRTMLELIIQEFSSLDTGRNYFLHVVGLCKGHVLLPPCSRPRTEVVPGFRGTPIRFFNNKFSFRLPEQMTSFEGWTAEVFLNNVVGTEVEQQANASIPYTPTTFQIPCSSLHVRSSKVGSLTGIWIFKESLPLSPKRTLPSVGSLGERGGLFSFLS